MPRCHSIIPNSYGSKYLLKFMIDSSRLHASTNRCLLLAAGFISQLAQILPCLQHRCSIIIFDCLKNNQIHFGFYHFMVLTKDQIIGTRSPTCIERGTSVIIIICVCVHACCVCVCDRQPEQMKLMAGTSPII